MAPQTQHDWYHTDEGVPPSAARQPWDLYGTPGVIDPHGRGLRITTAASVGYNQRKAFGADAGITQPRPEDYMEVSLRFEGVTDTGAFSGSGTSGHVMFIDDGERSLGVSIGNTLNLVDPFSGAVLLEIRQGWGWLHPQGYRLIKLDATIFELWVDGRLLARLPYEAGAASASATPIKGWGWLSSTGSGDAFWQAVDASMNVVLPPQWKVDRERSNMAGVLQANWNQSHRAMLRAFSGTTQAVQDSMTQLWERFTAGRLVMNVGRLDGTKLPLDADPPWLEVVLGGATITIERERLRFTSAPLPTVSGAVAAFIFPTPTNPTEASYRARATFIVRDFQSTDPEGRVGPSLSIQNGDQLIRAIMLRSRFNPELVGWIIQNGPSTGVIGDVGETHWYVNIHEPHEVELYVIARNRVILLVNGLLVDDQPYSNFSTAPTASHIAGIGIPSSGMHQVRFDAENIRVEQSYSANRQRPLFLQRNQERLIFVGGCERNDHIDVWNRNRHGVHQMRGTADGVRNELRRISCDDDLAVVSIQSPAEWFLEVSYPDVTPIYLEAQGVIAETVIEFQSKSPNFTPEALTALARKYILPRSVLEAGFALALATELTAATVSAATTTFTIDDPTGFDDGDDIELRELITGGTVLDLEYADRLLTRSSDTMLVSAFSGWVWADWTFDAPGEQLNTIDGTVSFPGLDSERVNIVTAGATLFFAAGSVAVVGFLDVYGIETGTGDAVRERVQFTAGGTLAGATVWDEVHGAVFSVPAQDTITITDAIDFDTLYVVGIGSQTRGAYLFDPGLLCGPAVFDAVSTGATTESIIIRGGESLGGTVNVELPLAGAVQVSTVEFWQEINVIAAGYIPAAESLFVGAVFTAPDGNVTLRSTSALDTMLGRVFGLDLNGKAQSEQILLDGISAAVGVLFYSHVLGVEIAESGAGFISVTITGGSIPVIVQNFDAAAVRGVGIDRRGIDTIGAITAEQSGAGAVLRPVVVFGVGDAGVYQVEKLEIGGTIPAVGVKSWRRIFGVATGGIPTTRTVQISGVAWRFDTARGLVVALAPLTAWIATIPVSTLDPVVDTVTDLDAKAAALALTGDYSVIEPTTINTIDQDTGAVDTPTIAGAFGIGAIMRRRTS
tara:strand:- start:3402 stop:6782 length:3381 start_codon:yes stop_codon:yes gene_type:complete